MKRIIIICLILLPAIKVAALDNRQKQINDIKKDRLYLYADITKATPDEALSHAVKLLQETVVIWVSERTGCMEIQMSGNWIENHYDTIMVMRANMYRVFAYAKKETLLPLFKQYNLSLVDSLDCEQNKVKASNDTILANERVRRLLKNNYLGRTDGVIDKIKKAKNFFELKEIMEPLRAKGDITDYGKYASTDNLEECYLIIYDPAGNIKAILGKGEEERENLKTGKMDLISNYRGCGAIWFKIKETINE